MSPPEYNSISPPLGISLHDGSVLQSQDSIESNNSSGSGKVSKNDSEQPKKKRRSTVRACDACAIRKVKCEVQRPCHHCVANNLNCTQLRQRKKSGPKNLHQKTLDSINSLSERQKLVEVNKKFDNNYENPETIIASNHFNHPIEMVPPSLTTSLINKNIVKDNKLDRTTLVEILNLVNEPIMNTILKEYTIKSLIDNTYKLVEFVNKDIKTLNNFNNKDPNYLSKVLLVLSFNLLIIENLIKLIQLNMTLNYSFKIHNIEYYKDLKNIILVKLIELFSIIDKLLLFPMMKYNNFQIFYNQSVSCINLFGYFDLITRFNNNNHNDNKEEIDSEDHNELYSNYCKVTYLRKAVSYYNFVDLKNEFIINKNDLTNFQLNELFEKLFVLERFNYFINPEIIISVNLLDMTFNLNSPNAIFKCFKLLNNDRLIFNNLKSFNILKNLNKFFKINHYPDLHNLMTKSYLNAKINLINYTKDSNFHSILIQIVIFKTLMIYSNNLELTFIEQELIEIVRNLNSLISFSDLVFLKFSNLKLLPQLLQILKINIDFENNLNYLEDLVLYTKKLFKFFKTTKNISQIISSNIVVYDWFQEMKNLEKVDIYHPKPVKNISKHDGIGFTSKSVPVYQNNPNVPNNLSNPNLSQNLPNSSNLSNSDPTLETSSFPQAISQQSPQQLQQLQFQLNKLQQSQINLQHISSNSTYESSKDKSEINDLLQDFGNSKLSSNSSTNPNSIVVTTNPSPEPVSPKPKETKLSDLTNSNSTSYSTIIQGGGPAPPIITPATAINKKDESEINLNVSESTKNLYNLFTQINDDVGTGSSNSLTNLFQFNSNLQTNSSMNLPKLSSLSNFKSSNNLNLINSSSTLNLFLNRNSEQTEEVEDGDKVKNELKNQFLL